MRMEDVAVLTEAPRWCGHRKPGGIYLVSNSVMSPCAKLPIPLEPCECCERTWQARGWTWFPTKLLPVGACELSDAHGLCDTCPAGNPVVVMGERCGLNWIGEKFYPSVDDFHDEARERGISRRIQTVPNGFVVGETYLALAHPLATKVDCPECGGEDDATECELCEETGRADLPGIFSLFRPTQAQYVCTGNETPEELDALVGRGLTPVVVNPVDDDGNAIEVD